MIEFKLDSKSGVPIYRQIMDQVRHGIASGRLRPGEQLPTVRALAVELAVNPNTVIKAYSLLEQQGVLTTEQGSGTFVSEASKPSLSPADAVGKTADSCRISRPGRSLRLLGRGCAASGSGTQYPEVVLMSGIPDPELHLDGGAPIHRQIIEQ